MCPTAVGPESRNTKPEDLSSLLPIFFFFFYIFIMEISESSWSAKQEMVTSTLASPRGLHDCSIRDVRVSTAQKTLDSAALELMPEPERG